MPPMILEEAFVDIHFDIDFDDFVLQNGDFRIYIISYFAETFTSTKMYYRNEY